LDNNKTDLGNDREAVFRGASPFYGISLPPYNGGGNFIYVGIS